MDEGMHTACIKEGVSLPVWNSMGMGVPRILFKTMMTSFNCFLHSTPIFALLSLNLYYIEKSIHQVQLISI